MATDARAVAERYLQEMLAADDAADFDLYVKRFEKALLVNFTRERFANDIAQMHERNGMNRGYEFLAELRPADVRGSVIHRSVWKGVYEKRDAVIEIGVYRKDDVWYVMTSAVH